MTKVDQPELAMKIVIVGDGAVGKSALLMTYTMKEFPVVYIPTVVENYQLKLRVGKKDLLHVDIWDTAGQEEFENIRKLSYQGCDVFMACYSCGSRTTLENVELKWLAELAKSEKGRKDNIPFVLVGTKADLLDDLAFRKDSIVTKKDAEEFAKRLKAFDQIQCSAKLYTNPSKSKVNEAFKLAVTCGLKKLMKSRGGCTVF